MTPSEHISAYIAKLGDWRGKMIARLRTLIAEAGPGLTEDWKWNTPVWSAKGNVLAVGAFQDHVKLNFFKGASLDDPHHLFNAGLEAKASRAIDIAERDRIDEPALKELVRAAAALSGGSTATATAKAKTPARAKKRK
jgi:hypothetical protein